MYTVEQGQWCCIIWDQKIKGSFSSSMCDSGCSLTAILNFENGSNITWLPVL